MKYVGKLASGDWVDIRTADRVQSHTKVWLDRRVQYLRALWGRREKTVVGIQSGSLRMWDAVSERALVMEKPSIEGKREKTGGKQEDSQLIVEKTSGGVKEGQVKD